MSKFPYGVWVTRQSPLDALVRLLPFSPLPSLLSVMETHHSRIPWPWKPRRGVEQRQMAALAQNNKSSNCPGIFYLIYNSLLSFISSSYITGSFRNDSPEEEMVTNGITPSELIGHVTCQLYSYLKWLETISNCCSEQTGSPAWRTLRRAVVLHLHVLQRSVIGIRSCEWNTPFSNKSQEMRKIADSVGRFRWSYIKITYKSLLSGPSSSVLAT